MDPAQDEQNSEVMKKLATIESKIKEKDGKSEQAATVPVAAGGASSAQGSAGKEQLITAENLESYLAKSEALAN
eukprot:3596333-Karenia_brevis.AAC.1